jgi:ribokinase
MPGDPAPYADRGTTSTSGPRWDVLGLGAIAVDDLLFVDGYAEPDTKLPVCSERREGGGLAATALVAVARTGGSAAYLAMLGDDELSTFALAELERAGVDLALIRRRPGARPVHSRIVIDRLSGRRTIFYSTAGVVDPSPRDVTRDLVTSARVLVVDSTVVPAATRAAQLARDAGIPVVADLEHAAKDGVPGLMALVDHLIVGTRFAADVTGDPPERAIHGLWRDDLAACVVTVGEDGCWYRAPESGGQVVHVPAVRVQALDTNGCGDVFHGAYAARIAQGDGVPAAVQAATKMAAAKAARGSGWDAVPAWTELTGEGG